MNRDRIDALLAATWPPLSTTTLGPWTLRDGGGGGKRASATSTRQPVTEAEIDRAERAMDDAGRQALFAVFADQDDLDRRLADRTYLCLDPTMFYHAPLDRIAGGRQGVHDVGTGAVRLRDDVGQSVYDVQTGDAQAMHVRCTGDVRDDDAVCTWAAGGIGPARIAVMDRVTAPKNVLVTTRDDTPIAAAFVAVHDGTAMIHALETAKAHRRQGAARATLAAAAHWAGDRGAETVALLVTRANDPANALYRSLGLSGQFCYHYRIRP